MAIRPQSANHAPRQNNTHSADVVGADPAVDAPSKRSRYRMARRLLTLGLGLAVIGSTGCTVVTNAGRSLRKSECIDEFMIGYRNRALAEKAWHCEKHRFCNKSGSFKDGFISGYIEVASGGPGCCPAVAPSHYWGWRYQSAHGQAAVNGWFEGYPLGVQAAEEDGLGHTQVIRTTGMMTEAPMLAPAIPSHTVIPGIDGIDVDAGVTNPFYSEPEVIPEPELIDAGEGEPEANDMDEVQIEAPEAVFQNTIPEFPIVEAPVNIEPELVKQSELVKTHEAAVSAKLADRVEDFPEPAEVVIDDLFGSPTTPVDTDADSEELPFTFE